VRADAPAARKRRRTPYLQAVPATVPAIGELAAELKAAGYRWCRWGHLQVLADLVVVLEEAGPAVQLASSRAGNLPDRPKTDKEDAQWIAG
jgi:hypothetical protein